MLPATLTGRTRLVPILAHPVGHVRAPSRYNPAFAAAGLDWCQVPMGVAPPHLPATLAVLAQLDNLQGVNLTLPHKSAGHRACRWLTPEASRTGMVNTLRLQGDGQWAGCNADGVGFVRAAQAHGLLDTQRPVALVGAGGAGTAIADALLAAGVGELHCWDLDPARARTLMQVLSRAYPGRHLGDDATALGRAGLVINATPLGLEPSDPMPLDPARLAPDAAVFDIIAARDTELLQAARQRGLRVLDGVAMIDHQLALQISFWRGDDFALEPAP